MKKIKEHSIGILIIVLLAGGICAIVFGKSTAVQGGLGALCWGLAVLIVAWVSKQRNEYELIKFDNDVKTILADIAQNQEESDYFGINADMANRARYRIYKKGRKQLFSCTALGAILVIIAIICFV